MGFQVEESEFDLLESLFRVVGWPVLLVFNGIRLIEVEFAFFNLEAHVRELQKELEKVEGLKQAVDDALAAQQDKFNMDL
jgi:hypothetical protein